MLALFLTSYKLTRISCDSGWNTEVIVKMTSYVLDDCDYLWLGLCFEYEYLWIQQKPTPIAGGWLVLYIPVSLYTVMIQADIKKGKP